MASVTFPPALGGDGSTVTDDSSPTTGLASGGHRTRFVPALAQAVAVMSGAVTQAGNSASAAAASQAAAAASAASAVNSPGTSATSTTSLAVGTGSKTLTVQTGKNFVVGQPVMIARTSAPGTTWMAGNVTSYTSGTGNLVVNVTWAVGTGTFTDWTIGLAGPANPSTALVSILAASTNLNTVTTSGFYRLANGNTNAPAVVDYGQLIVSRGGDTILQIVTGYTTGQIWFRHGNPTDVGGSGSWTAWRLMGGNESINIISGNTTAVPSATYVITATLTLTLPASPLAGDRVSVVNRSGTTTPVIARNGKNIMGLAEDMTLDSDVATIRLVFTDAPRGWVIN